MFIPLHVLTVLSVLFLIVLVLFAWRGGRTGQSAPVHPPIAQAPSALSPEAEREVRLLVARGDRIGAVKLVRETMQLDLAEAHDLVDRIEQEGDRG